MKHRFFFLYSISNRTRGCDNQHGTAAVCISLYCSANRPLTKISIYSPDSKSICQRGWKKRVFTSHVFLRWIHNSELHNIRPLFCKSLHHQKPEDWEPLLTFTEHFINLFPKKKTDTESQCTNEWNLEQVNRGFLIILRFKLPNVIWCYITCKHFNNCTWTGWDQCVYSVTFSYCPHMKQTFLIDVFMQFINTTLRMYRCCERARLEHHAWVLYDWTEWNPNGVV